MYTNADMMENDTHYTIRVTSYISGGNSVKHCLSWRLLGFKLPFD